MKMVLKILGFFAGLAGSLCATLSSITFGAWLLKLCVPALFVGSGFATYPLGMLALKFTLAGIGLGILSLVSIALGTEQAQPATTRDWQSSPVAAAGRAHRQCKHYQRPSRSGAPAYAASEQSAQYGYWGHQ